MRSLLLSLSILAMAPLLGAADTPPATLTVQQEFDAAVALTEGRKLPDALAAWEKLEKRVADRPRSLAIVRLRKAQVLYQLDRRDDAVAAAKAGLTLLPASDPMLRADRFEAYALIAKIAEISLDYATAAENYRLADGQASSPIEHLASLRGLIETETFVDSDAALRDLARAQPYLADASIDNPSKAVLKRVESQLKLNRGDFAGARVAAGEAVKLLGGLTTKTDLADVAARSNYAIASMLLGNLTDARLYMAYTGAGRLDTGSFDPAVQMTPPDCGDSDLQPDDMGVVEFSIGDDGTVVLASPVYASRGGKVGLAFARAVRNWSWAPEQVKALPRFFRNRARVELRCSTEFPKPSLRDYLDKSLAAWLVENQIDMPLKREGSDAALLPIERRQLAEIEAAKGKDSLALVPVLHALWVNTVTPRDERGKFAQREAAILVANKAPPSARLSADLAAWFSQSSDSWGGRAYFRMLEAAATTGPYAEDVKTRSALRLAMADIARTYDKDRSLAVLDLVANDPALAKDDGLRVGALIRAAAIYTQRGKLAAAQAAFAKSGTTADQCSLVDSTPRRVSFGGTFPDAARMWGFEGWVSVQFDLTADGKTLNPRAVISYPPFIFTGAGSDAFRTARYEKTYRPGGGLACGGITQRVRFVMRR
ncbi:MAG: hypothetical protein V4459_05855 [Pseudomonadota bacterium]